MTICKFATFSAHLASSLRFSFKRHNLWRPWLSELGSCVKVEVDVLGSPSLIVLIVSVDVKQH